MSGKQTEQYKIYEEQLIGTDAGNPYRDIRLTAAFTNGTDTVEVHGFYCGRGSYKIRFMPRIPGIWTAVTSSNDDALHGVELRCECIPAKEGNHGCVRLLRDIRPELLDKEESKFHFAYEDGTRFQVFGTTCYAWIHQQEDVQEQTLRSLGNAPFNKIRMCIFPKYYTYNTSDPGMYPFEETKDGGFRYDCFNPEFWDHLEKRIKQLDELGIEADMILLHPYDKWGFSKMEQETDIFYLKYAIDRLCHFKNVWWSMANEYDLMPWKSVEDWEQYAEVVVGRDPYGHLRSIHNCMKMYDHTRPWITHVSVQRLDVYKTAEMVTEWRELYQKPIVVDECAYEGNINLGWGNISGEELTRRFWEGSVRGGYLSHGEVYVQYEQIWWSHGGELHGTSPTRIGFLKQVMEDVPQDAHPLKLTADNFEQNWDVPCLCNKEQSYFLYYFGFFKPLYRTFELPEGRKYEVELIDTWDMTVEKLPGCYEGDIRIELPEKQYMAVRMKSV